MGMSSDESPISEAEVLRQINSAKQSLEDNKNQLNEHLYNAMDIASRTAIEYLNRPSTTTASGWATKVTDRDGNPIWNAEQSAQVESSLPKSLQAGGFSSNSASDIRLTPQSTVFTSKIPADISLDKIVKSVSDFLASVDEKNREIAMAIGSVAYINKIEKDPGIGPFLPYIPIRLSMSPRLILPILNSMLEACRLLVTTNRFDNPMLRKVLSVVLSILDISRGEWRDGVLSLLGVISRDALFIGVIGKTTRFVYNWISPDIQARIEKDVYAASKSMFIGGWLWLLSVAAPKLVRDSINKLFDSSRESLETWKKSLEPMQDKAKESGEKLGLTVKFPEIPLTLVPSFDDIQNLQSILHQPEVICNPMFQQQIQPLMGIPVIRILLELLNIPTTPEAKEEVCKGQPATMVESVTQLITPTVTREIPHNILDVSSITTRGGYYRRFMRREYGS